MRSAQSSEDARHSTSPSDVESHILEHSELATAQVIGLTNELVALSRHRDELLEDLIGARSRAEHWKREYVAARREAHRATICS